jgi:hypothetical protein
MNGDEKIELLKKKDLLLEKLQFRDQRYNPYDFRVEKNGHIPEKKIRMIKKSMNLDIKGEKDFRDYQHESKKTKKNKQDDDEEHVNSNMIRS